MRTILVIAALLISGTVAAEPLVHVETIVSPTGRPDRTGMSVALSETHLVIGVPNYDHKADPPEGAARVYELATRRHLHDLIKPSPVLDRRFGRAVAMAGNRALVCGWPWHWKDRMAVVYRVGNGEQILRLSDPSRQNDNDFARSCAMSDSHILIGAPGEGADKRGIAYLFDAGTGALIRTFEPPIPRKRGRFGLRVALWGPYAAVTAYKIVDGITPDGAVFIFDVETGDLLHTIPEPENVGGYTAAISMAEGRLLVGYTFARINGSKRTAAAALYDLETGELLHLLTPPDGIRNRDFGARAALSDKWALIASSDARDRKRRFKGMVFLFDAESGALVQIITNPEPDRGGIFPISLAFRGDWVALGTLRQDHIDGHDGAVHLFRFK